MRQVFASKVLFESALPLVEPALPLVEPALPPDVRRGYALPVLMM
jgi:hypothetical protein